MISSKKILYYFIIFSGSIIIVVLIIGGYMISWFKQSEAYKTAVNHAKQNSEIKKTTGGVVGVGYMVGGEITETSADLTFKVNGVNKDLKLFYELIRTDSGTWQVDSFSY